MDRGNIQNIPSTRGEQKRNAKRGQSTSATVLASSTNLPHKPSDLTKAKLSPLAHFASPSPFPTVDPRVTICTRIGISFSGETFTYDLESLQSDPREIVELLKKSASERGNWMIVGAHYRRKGNPQAALVVISTMLEVMAQLRIPEQDLKPAFLLLSSCEKDLGQTKRADAKTSSEHYRNSQKWLEKVYGPGSVPIQTSTASASLAPVPRALSSLPSKPSLPARPTSLEREVQSLRDRLNNHVSLLTETRNLKRKLEDDFDAERDMRRKLERQVDDLRRDRDEARKMETYALDQMRREVDTRRRAEELARELQMDLDRYNRPLSSYGYEPIRRTRSPSPYRRSL